MSHDDVGVYQLSRNLRFEQETVEKSLPAFGIESLWQLYRLERDLAIENGIVATIDDPHRPAAELTADFVAP